MSMSFQVVIPLFKSDGILLVQGPLLILIHAFASCSIGYIAFIFFAVVLVLVFFAGMVYFGMKKFR